MAANVLVVIGAGGMGVAIARRLGSGSTLVLADVAEEPLKATAAVLAGEGHEVVPHVVDVSSRESVHALARAAAEIGPVTRVAHTAGLSPVQAPVEAVLAVDLLGTALVLDEFGAVVAPGGAGVMVSSMSGHLIGSLPDDQEARLATTPADDLPALPFAAPDKFFNSGHAYAFAKRGNVVRVQAAARAWGARGARVNSISPGVISTAMGQSELASESGASMRAMVAGSATGRLGTPDDIAAAAEFLLGPAASFVTGTDLLVDGGVVGALRSGQIDLSAVLGG